jgi:hypothetical protein
MIFIGAPSAVGVPLFDGPEGEALMFSDSDRDWEESRGAPGEKEAAFFKAMTS